jgi:hypothetical protein
MTLFQLKKSYSNKLHLKIIINGEYLRVEGRHSTEDTEEKHKNSIQSS